MPDNPAAELRAAAARLRPSSPAVATHTVAVRIPIRAADALADWLEAEAAGNQAVAGVGDVVTDLMNVEMRRDGHRAVIEHSTLPQALAVARAINQQQPRETGQEDAGQPHRASDGSTDADTTPRASQRRTAARCACGEPDTPETIHRTDGPCHIDHQEQPTEPTDADRLWTLETALRRVREAIAIDQPIEYDCRACRAHAAGLHNAHNALTCTCKYPCDGCETSHQGAPQAAPDDRRTQYRAALNRFIDPDDDTMPTLSKDGEGFTWVPADTTIDAVMAVADREMQQLRAELAASDVKVLGQVGLEYQQRAWDAEAKLRLAHQARRAKEHQLDDIRRALCDAGAMQDDDPYSHADLADVIRQTSDSDTQLRHRAEQTEAERDELHTALGLEHGQLHSAALSAIHGRGANIRELHQRAEQAEKRLRAVAFTARHWHQHLIDHDNIPGAHAVACVRAALGGETRPGQLGLDDAVHDAFRTALNQAAEPEPSPAATQATDCPEEPPQPTEAEQIADTIHTLQTIANRVREAVTTDEPTWTPPPPGDTREQLPDHLLALLDMPPYLSTACSTGQVLECDLDQPHASERNAWAERLHLRCRTNHKFTGQICCCDCHTETLKEPTP